MGFQAFLFGQPRFISNQNPLRELQSNRLSILLCYLILEGNPSLSRVQIARTLWPAHTETDALRNLRAILHRLLSIFPELKQYLSIERDEIIWQKSREIWCDVRQMESLWAQVATPASLQEAIQLYRGPLLENQHSPWLTHYRHSLKQRFLNWLREAARLFEQKRQYSSTRIALELLLLLDPSESVFALDKSIQS